MPTTGIRGAICAERNTAEAIHGATRTLLTEILARNRLGVDGIVAAFFTMTPDLDADFPAHAARSLGWSRVPMLGAQESDVDGAMPRVIRVLLLAEGSEPARHVYLGEAARMRPDLTSPGDRGPAVGPAPPGDTRSDDIPDASRAGDLGRLLVVGLGLIGGSVAAAGRASSRFSHVCGFDSDASALATAMKRNLIDSAGSSLSDALSTADMIVLATPVDSIVTLLDAVAQHAADGSLITDVGSSKRRIVAAMTRLPARLDAVGGHPMAGDTASGAAFARPGLLDGATWALIQTERGGGRALRRAERLVRAVGARPIQLTADAHDRAVAITSHVPALLSTALVECGGELLKEPPTRAMAGPGFASSSRLAAGNPEMTAQMVNQNADNVRSVLGALVAHLSSLGEELEAGRERDLEGRLQAARAQRLALFEAESHSEREVD